MANVRHECIDFTKYPVVSGFPNPWPFVVLVITTYDHQGNPLPSNETRQGVGGDVGLHTGYKQTIGFLRAFEVIRLTVEHSADPLTLYALDDQGNVLRQNTMSQQRETFEYADPNISTIVIDAPNDEGLLLEVCQG